MHLLGNENCLVIETTQLGVTLGCEELIVHPFLKAKVDRKLKDWRKGDESLVLARGTGRGRALGEEGGHRRGRLGP